MKRVICLVLSVIIIISLCCISLARHSANISEIRNVTQYSKDTDSGDMDEVFFGCYRPLYEYNDSFDSISWILLEYNKDENYALLLSTQALDAKPYDSTNANNVTWEDCTLRKWLNNDFINDTFTDTEKSQLLLQEKTYSMPNFGGGENTFVVNDYVSLLSEADCLKYFNKREAYQDIYNLNQKRLATVITDCSLRFDTNTYTYNKLMDTFWNTYNCYYWLIDITKTSSVTNRRAMSVDPLGNVRPTGNAVTEFLGVRPMIKVKADALEKCFAYDDSDF